MKISGWKSSATGPGALQRENINKSVFDISCHKKTLTTAQRQYLDEPTRSLAADSAAVGYHGGGLGSNSQGWIFPIALPKPLTRRCRRPTCSR